MAITRAQQVRQMLEDGGMLVKPSTDGKRPGYRSAKFQSARSKSMSAGKTSKSKSSSSSKGYTGGGGGGADAGGSQSPGGGTFKPPAQKYVPGPGDTGSDDPPSPITPPEESKKKSFFKKFVPPTQKLLYGLVGNNPKNEKAYVKYLQSQGVNIPSDLLDILNLKDDEDVDFSTYQKLVGYEPEVSLEQQRNLFKNLEEGDDPFAKASAFPMDFASYMASKGNFGLITGGNLGNLKDFKNPGGIIDPKTGLPMSDLEFEKLKIASSQYEPGGGGDPTDPCKGPNPPAYCKVNNDDDDDTTTPPPSTGVFAGIAPRFAGSTFDFDKLRAGAMDGGMIEDTPVGGIMDLESGRQMYFLGKLVKKAKRAVKKVVKSPFGKIALLGLGAGMAGFGPAKGLFASGKGLGFKKFLTDSIMGKAIGVDSPAGGGGIIRSGGLLNFVKNNPYKSIFAGSALLGLMGDKDDDGFDIDKYYKTAGLGGQEGIDAIRLQGLNALSNRFRVADGGRIGLKDGPSLESILEGRIPPMPMPDPLQKILEKMTPEEKEMFKMRMEIMKRGFIRNIEPNPDAVKPVPMPTYGPDGKRSFAEGGDVEPVAKKTMPLIDMDGKEKDYRETGGFVDMG